MSIGVEQRIDSETVRITGTIGLVSAVAVAVILGVHPPGSTELYDDGVESVGKASLFWITIHVTAALVTLAFPLVVSAWGSGLDTARARVFGGFAGMVAIVGTALGVVHLVGTDTIAFAFYQDTLDSGVEGAATGADVLLRLHAATLTSWIVGFWIAVPVLAAVAAWIDRRRDWQLYLPAVGAVLAVASVVVAIGERQYTFASDMLLFRTSVTLFIVWIGLIGYTMRRRAST